MLCQFRNTIFGSRRVKAGGDVRYWSPVNTPISDLNGEIQYIIHKVHDVTDFVRLKQQGI